MLRTRFGSSPRLAPLGWQENINIKPVLLLHPAGPSRAVVRTQSEIVLPSLREPFLSLSEPKRSEPQLRGLVRDFADATVRTESFTGLRMPSTHSDSVKNIGLYSEGSQKDIC
jgi:hypothetical protein